MLFRRPSARKARQIRGHSPRTTLKSALLPPWRQPQERGADTPYSLVHHILPFASFLIIITSWSQDFPAISDDVWFNLHEFVTSSMDVTQVKLSAWSCIFCFYSFVPLLCLMSPDIPSRFLNLEAEDEVDGVAMPASHLDVPPPGIERNASSISLFRSSVCKSCRHPLLLCPILCLHAYLYDSRPYPQLPWCIRRPLCPLHLTLQRSRAKTPPSTHHTSTHTCLSMSSRGPSEYAASQDTQA